MKIANTPTHYGMFYEQFAIQRTRQITKIYGPTVFHAQYHSELVNIENKDEAKQKKKKKKKGSKKQTNEISQERKETSIQIVFIQYNVMA